MSWHRIRRGVGGKPDPIEYKEKTEKLSELKQLEDEGKIDLYYLDESGFCGIPCVPYGWQDIGEYLSIDSRKTKRLNVLGIMNRQNTLHAYISEQTINSLCNHSLYRYFLCCGEATNIYCGRSSFYSY